MIDYKKVLRKSVYKSLYLSIASMLLVLMCITSITWAFFSSDAINDNNSIEAGTFNVKVYKVIDTEVGEEILNPEETTSFDTNTKYRFVKNGNTSGYFKASYKAEGSIAKLIYGIFDENTADQSYFDLLVNTNTDVEFKIEEINWGTPKIEEGSEIEDEPSPKLLLNSANNVETIYLNKDEENEITFGTTTIFYDPNVSRLLEGYQEIEYLNLDGNQYIDLDIISNNNLRFVVSGDNDLDLTNLAYIENNEESNYYIFKVLEDGECVVESNYDNEDYYICLFGSYVNGVKSSLFNEKITSIDIYEEDNLIRKLVPARKNDVIGLYDLISDKFYQLNGEYSNDSDDVFCIKSKLIKAVDINQIESEIFDYIKDDNYQLTDDEFAISGLKFEGWSLSKDGEILNENEDGYYHIDTKDNNEITLYAVWSYEKYSIEYVLNDGILNDAEYEYTVADNISFRTPVKDGYTFLGWFLDENFENEIKSTDGYFTDLKIFAKWDLIDENIVENETNDLPVEENHELKEEIIDE